jgi:polysaccharide export outer membrane protein
MRYLLQCALLALTLCTTAFAQLGGPAKPAEPPLGIGDVVHLTVYQNPDLTTDARISENGQINVPLIGTVAIAGLTARAAEQKVAKLLKDGGYVLKPEVTIQTLQIRSSLVSIIGQVGKHGRYPIDFVGSTVSQMIAAAGGVLPTGADVVTLVGHRQGKSVKLDVDLPAILQAGKANLDVPVQNGDIIYVERAPMFYIYGEVQRPGTFRLERGMTLMQALAQGGGLTARGTERGIRVNRRDANGVVQTIELKMNDPIEPDDVVYVRESLF